MRMMVMGKMAITRCRHLILELNKGFLSGEHGDEECNDHVVTSDPHRAVFFSPIPPVCLVCMF